MDPWLEAAAIGLLGLLVGLGFVFYGFRLFLILLPIWGFFVGFLFGANATTAIFGDGFLATTTGWVIGLVVGLVFAVLAYLYYWFAVVFIGASVGYAIGLGVLAWLGNGGDNLMGLIFGLVGAVIGGGLMIVLRVPKYLVIVLTAIGGALASVTGIALILNQIKLDQLDNGLFGGFQSIKDIGWLWALAAIALAVAGMVYQNRMIKVDEAILMESYRNPGMPPSTTV